MVLGVFFVFFVAEDGIRDYKVTRVQTCALPISPHLRRFIPTGRGEESSIRTEHYCCHDVLVAVQSETYTRCDECRMQRRHRGRLNALMELKRRVDCMHR